MKWKRPSPERERERADGLSEGRRCKRRRLFGFKNLGTSPFSNRPRFQIKFFVLKSYFKSPVGQPITREVADN